MMIRLYGVLLALMLGGLPLHAELCKYGDYYNYHITNSTSKQLCVALKDSAACEDGEAGLLYRFDPGTTYATESSNDDTHWVVWAGTEAVCSMGSESYDISGNCRVTRTDCRSFFVTMTSGDGKNYPNNIYITVDD